MSDEKLEAFLLLWKGIWPISETQRSYSKNRSLCTSQGEISRISLVMSTESGLESLEFGCLTGWSLSPVTGVFDIADDEGGSFLRRLEYFALDDSVFSSAVKSSHSDTGAGIFCCLHHIMTSKSSESTFRTFPLIGSVFMFD